MHVHAAIHHHTPCSKAWPLLTALALLLCSLLFFWPGIASYDTVVQYQQILSGSYDDWHPPIMARLWSILPFARHGTAPMFMLQLSAYWIGLGLLAQSLSGRKAIGLLAVGATPFLLGWLAIVIKDSQLIGALALATGLIAHYRLRRRSIPAPALAVIILCLIYATLVRANAVFSTVPLAMLLLPRPWHGLARLILMISAIPVILLLSQPINHDLLGAQDSGVRRTQPIYDLAGIAARTGDGLPAAAVETLVRHHCVKPLFWDSLSGALCQSAINPWQKAPIGPLTIDLAKAAARHPMAYLSHRLAHLNSTERWLVPLRWPLATPPARSEPNDLGLVTPPNPLATQWQHVAASLAQTPLAWPILWVAAAIWGLWAAYVAAPDSGRDMAVALFTSALFQEASFAAISISSDLRYHLWAMLATVIGWLILGRERLRGQRTAALAIALLLLSGAAARLILPPTPAYYAKV